MPDTGHKQPGDGSEPPSVFLSFHRRGGSHGGGEHVSENFRKIVREVVGESVVELFHDDLPQVRASGDLKVDVRRRSTIAVAFRLFALGNLGRLKYTFQTTAAGENNRPLLFVDGVGHASVLPGSIDNFRQSVLLHHNFEPDYYADAYFGRWQKPWYVRAGLKSERTAMRYAALNLFLTRSDLEKTVRACANPDNFAEVFGVYETAQPLVVHSREKDGRLRVLITGNLSTRKGYLGTVELLLAAIGRKTVLQQKLRFVVAGRNPSTELCALADGDFVRVIPNPPSISELAQNCDVYLNPNYTGSGIKIRNFDGLRNGLPVLCRRENAAGFEDLGVPAFQTFVDADDGIAQLESLPFAETTSTRMREKVWGMYSARFDLRNGVSHLRQVLGKL